MTAEPTTQEAVNHDPLYSPTGAAEYLGLVDVVRHPAQAVRSLCRKRYLKSTKVCGKVAIRRSWLEAYLSKHEVAE